MCIIMNHEILILMIRTEQNLRKDTYKKINNDENQLDKIVGTHVVYGPMEKAIT